MIWQIVWMQLVSNSMCLSENSLQTFLEITFFCHNEQNGFLRSMKPPGLRISSDLYFENVYGLSETNTKALVGKAMDAGFKGK